MPLSSLEQLQLPKPLLNFHFFCSLIIYIISEVASGSVRDGAAEGRCTLAFSTGGNDRNVSVWGKDKYLNISCPLCNLEDRPSWRNPESPCYRKGEPLAQAAV